MNTPDNMGIIAFDDGWRVIHQHGIRKLLSIISSSALHAQPADTRGRQPTGQRMGEDKEDRMRGEEERKSQVSADASTHFSHQEYVNLYTTIYRMCIQKDVHCHTKKLYEKYELTFEDYLSTVVSSRMTRAASTSSESIIETMVHCWHDHLIMKKWMIDFFRYLDRFYVRREQKKSLAEVATLYDYIVHVVGMV